MSKNIYIVPLIAERTIPLDSGFQIYTLEAENEGSTLMYEDIPDILNDIGIPKTLTFLECDREGRIFLWMYDSEKSDMTDEECWEYSLLINPGNENTFIEILQQLQTMRLLHGA